MPAAKPAPPERAVARAAVQLWRSWRWQERRRQMLQRPWPWMAAASGSSRVPHRRPLSSSSSSGMQQRAAVTSLCAAGRARPGRPAPAVAARRAAQEHPMAAATTKIWRKQGSHLAASRRCGCGRGGAAVGAGWVGSLRVRSVGVSSPQQGQRPACPPRLTLAHVVPLPCPLSLSCSTGNLLLPPSHPLGAAQLCRRGACPARCGGARDHSTGAQSWLLLLH